MNGPHFYTMTLTALACSTMGQETRVIATNISCPIELELEKSIGRNAAMTTLKMLNGEYKKTCGRAL